MAIKTTPEIAEKVENKPIICLKDVAIAYQTNVALFDVNLDIFQNDLFGICGPNGSGKSTLLKAIVGSVEPFRGHVKVFRKDISNLSPEEQVKVEKQREKTKELFDKQIQQLEDQFSTIQSQIDELGASDEEVVSKVKSFAN